MFLKSFESIKCCVVYLASYWAESFIYVVALNSSSYLVFYKRLLVNAAILWTKKTSFLIALIKCSLQLFLPNFIHWNVREVKESLSTAFIKTLAMALLKDTVWRRSWSLTRRRFHKSHSTASSQSHYALPPPLLTENPLLSSTSSIQKESFPNLVNVQFLPKFYGTVIGGFFWSLRHSNSWQSGKESH